MKQFDRILVGLALSPDGSGLTTGSRRAALQAHWLAEKIGASITFVHSTWSDLYEDGGVMVQGPDAEEALDLEGLLAEYSTGDVEVDLVYSKERPWIDLIHRVQRGEGDLVVVARRNEPERDAIGSVALKLMRKCPAPVWVVKPDAPLTQQCVMAATDLSKVGDRAIEYAAFVARSNECALHVVHAWQKTLSSQFTSELEGHEADMDVMQKRAEEAVSKSMEPHVEGLDTKMHVGCDAPSRAILEGIDALGVDLLVMGTVSREGVFSVWITPLENEPSRIAITVHESRKPS